MGFPLNLKYSFEGTPTKEETLQFIREDIYGELEAIALYDAHIRATSCELTKKVLSDIRDEEKVHVYELLNLLIKVDPSEINFANKAFDEVSELLAEKTNNQEDISSEIVEKQDVKKLFSKAKTLRELFSEVNNGWRINI